jgi:hypothetical protein
MRIGRWLLPLLLLSACGGEPQPDGQIPTVAQLPSLTPSPSHTATVPASVTTTSTSTLTPTLTLTASTTPTTTLTVTPSMTITDTPAPTLTASPSPPARAVSIAALALTALNATVLPQTPPPVPPAAPTNPAQPPGVPTLTPLAAVSTPAFCPFPPPGALATMLSGAPALRDGLGCATGAVVTLAGAAQVFESGIMYYLPGAPKSIYVLTIDGRFRRFDDTWIDGVDPSSGGEVPPAGLIEPIRGFGKVWRTNPEVRAALGWAITNELGDHTSVQYFDHGRAIYLPVRGETVILLDDLGAQSGIWQAFSGSF